MGKLLHKASDDDHLSPYHRVNASVQSSDWSHKQKLLREFINS